MKLILNNRLHIIIIIIFFIFLIAPVDIDILLSLPDIFLNYILAIIFTINILSTIS